MLVLGLLHPHTRVSDKNIPAPLLNSLLVFFSLWLAGRDFDFITKHGVGMEGGANFNDRKKAWPSLLSSMTDLLPVEGMVLGVLAEGSDAVEYASWGVRLEYLHWSPFGCSPVHHLNKVPIKKEFGTLPKNRKQNESVCTIWRFRRNTKDRFAPKNYHLTEAELGTSDRIPIFRYSDSYRTKYHLSDIGLTCLSDFNNRISYIGLPISDTYRNYWNLSDKNGEFLLFFTSFFKNFSPFWRLFGEFSRKLMTCCVHIMLLVSILCCWCPYCAVGVHIVLLASILCCWRPYCAVGVPADASTVVG